MFFRQVLPLLLLQLLDRGLIAKADIRHSHVQMLKLQTKLLRMTPLMSCVSYSELPKTPQRLHKGTMTALPTLSHVMSCSAYWLICTPLYHQGQSSPYCRCGLTGCSVTACRIECT